MARKKLFTQEANGKLPWIRSTGPGQKKSQQASKPASQHNSKPVNQQAGKLVKATFYLEPGDTIKLEEIRLKRRKQGDKSDKSSLVREAIKLLVSQ